MSRFYRSPEDIKVRHQQAAIERLLNELPKLYIKPPYDDETQTYYSEADICGFIETLGYELDEKA